MQTRQQAPQLPGCKAVVNAELLEILRLAKELGVSFAFPSQSLYVESTPEQPFPEHQAGDLGQLAATAKDFGPQGKIAKPGGLGIFTAPYKD